MRAEGVSFRHAVELLRNQESKFPSNASNAQPQTLNRVIKHSTVRRLPPPVALGAEDRELLRQVVDYYHEALKQSPEAMGYLKKRGLDSSEMIAHFKIGFANRTLGYRPPKRSFYARH